MWASRASDDSALSLKEAYAALRAARAPGGRAPGPGSREDAVAAETGAAAAAAAVALTLQGRLPLRAGTRLAQLVGLASALAALARVE